MAQAQETIIIDVKLNGEDVAKKLGDVNAQLNILNEENKELKKNIKEGNDVMGQNSQKLAENESKIKSLNSQKKNYIAAIEKEMTKNKTYGTSLNDLNQKLKDQTAVYNSLNEADRKSSFGKQLRKDMDKTKESISEIKGSNTNLIGSLNGLLAGSKNAFSGLISGLGNAAKAFVTNPIGAIVTALVLVFNKLKEAFSKSDDAGTKLQSALSALKPVTELVGKAFDVLANALGDLALKFSTLVTKWIPKLTGGLARIFEFFGADETAENMRNWADGYEEASKKANELVLTLDKLEDKEREYTVNSAKRQKEISELKAKAADTDKYTAEERANYLDKAIQLEAKDLKESLYIAKEKLRIKQEQYKQEVNTSDEAKNELAKLQADVYAAEKNYNDKIRELGSQRNAARKEAMQEDKKAFEETSKNLEKLVSNTESILQDAKKAAVDAMKDGREKELAELELKYDGQKSLIQSKIDDINTIISEASAKGVTISDEDMALLQSQLDAYKSMMISNEESMQQEKTNIMQKYDAERLEKELSDMEARQQKERQELEDKNASETAKAELEYNIAKEKEEWLLNLNEEEKAALFETDEEYFNSVNKASEDSAKVQKKFNEAMKKQSIENLNQITGSTKIVADALVSTMEEFGVESEALKKVQRATGLARIAYDTGVAIAGGVAQAQSAGPFPANLIAIATTVATVLANIVQAKKLFSEGDNYATGGIVPGTSYTGDNVRANVNSGEMILNMDQQRNLLNMANTGAITSESYTLLAAAFSESIKNMPAPVLDYSEFTNFTNDIDNRNNLVTIK